MGNISFPAEEAYSMADRRRLSAGVAASSRRSAMKPASIHDRHNAHPTELNADLNAHEAYAAARHARPKMTATPRSPPTPDKTMNRNIPRIEYFLHIFNHAQQKSSARH
jgi:hypothetical protein